MSFETSQQALAFSLGSQARLDGLSEYDNPYHDSDKGRRSQRTYWRDGYRDVERFWGHWAQWPVQKLPAIGEVA